MESSHQKIKDDVRKAYNNIAQRYLEWTRASHARRLSYLQDLLARLKAPQEDDVRKASVLELGCGAGVPCTQVLASQDNLTVTANDISSAQIALARQHLPPSSSVTLIESDMMELAFPDEQFDAVIAMYSIIHLPRDEQVALMKRIFQWLKPGGWFLANFCATEYQGLTDPHWLGGTEGTMYWSAWGVDKNCAILTDIGFELAIRDVVDEVEDDGNGDRIIPFLWAMAKKAGRDKDMK
ncbi:hypothetical protein VTN77DRAFT_8547 [Rasamsonia byssochlamydoides]|uniref:uncharacterized protein n=1 Tax=Rasamsonia byssochlamydoides TaxID=89139 RepID=UPI003742F233